MNDYHTLGNIIENYGIGAQLEDWRKMTTANDPVSHPAHYTQGKIEVLDFILDQGLPYLPGQVIKYICRYRFKNGLEDLQKAEFYLKRLIEEWEI